MEIDVNLKFVFFFQLLPIFSTIKSIAGEMKCFDFEDTLFVRNKWDSIDADKKKKEKIKIKLNKRIKEEWPWVKENHIFDTCLKKVRIHA